MDETDSDIPNTASHTPATTPSLFHQKGADSSVSVQSSELFSSSPTDHGLDEYAFVAPEFVQSVTSPDSDASIFFGHLQSKYSDINLRRRRTRALGATPSSTGGRSKRLFVYIFVHMLIQPFQVSRLQLNAQVFSNAIKSKSDFLSTTALVQSLSRKHQSLLH
jgi:hypothetical protein